MMEQEYLRIVEELVWEEIARDLRRPVKKAVGLVEKSKFCDHLIQNLSFPLKVLSTSDRESYDLIR